MFDETMSFLLADILRTIPALQFFCHFELLSLIYLHYTKATLCQSTILSRISNLIG